MRVPMLFFMSYVRQQDFIHPDYILKIIENYHSQAVISKMNRYQLEQVLDIPTVLADLVHEYATGPNEEKKREEDVHLGRWPHWIQYTVMNRDYVVEPDDVVDTMIQTSVDEIMESDIYNSYDVTSLRELYDMYDMGFRLEDDGNGGYVWSE